MNEVLLYLGSGIITLWGVAHILPTGSVVASFGTLSDENRYILRMEWLMEAVLLIFIGVLAFLLTISGEVENAVGIAVYRALAILLVVMAGVSLMTGARTRFLPMKLCPVIFLTVAMFFVTATFL